MILHIYICHTRISLHLIPFLFLFHPLLISLTRPSHITINRQTKRRKARTPQCRSLRPCRSSQHTARNTTRHNPILQIILRSESLNTAFRTRKYRAYLPEILS
jgi:hypothetical protein